VARETASGAIAGVITLGEIAGGISQSAYLGYYGTARRGLMAAAVLRACRIVFDEFGLHRLEANIQPGNAASITLVRRLGFRFKGFSPRYLCIGGIWRDHERWALLANEVQHS
jgi:ribosomal-protein-alanine N-acetyltransferase